MGTSDLTIVEQPPNNTSKASVLQVEIVLLQFKNKQVTNLTFHKQVTTWSDLSLSSPPPPKSLKTQDTV